MRSSDVWRLLLGALLCASIATSAQSPQQEASSPPQPADQVFKADTELVVLQVNVFDKRSDAVPELPQSAFMVFEDDAPQEITLFNAGDVPVTVGLVIDNSTSMITERDMTLSAAAAFADSSHPEDEMFAIVFNERIRPGLPPTLQFTKNRLQLRASLQRYPPGGKTAFYDAIIAALDHLEKAGYQKRVLVVLSDGGDNASMHTEKEMLDRVAASNALIYTVLDPNVAVVGESRPDMLKRISRLSGGVSYFPKSSRDLVADFQEIAGNIRRGYSIGYLPSSTHRHDVHHRVKVTVRMAGRHDLSVRVRDGYSENDPPGTH